MSTKLSKLVIDKTMQIMVEGLLEDFVLSTPDAKPLEVARMRRVLQNLPENKITALYSNLLLKRAKVGR